MLGVAQWTYVVRPPTEADYPRVVEALTTWWDSEGLADRAAELLGLLPRLYLQHFGDTSLLVESEGQLVAFLVGFLSHGQPHVGYIHFVGVTPDLRKQGLARALYERFFDICRLHGCTHVHCITSPQNARSVAFHQRMGFRASEPIADYDGPGLARVAFVRAL